MHSAAVQLDFALAPIAAALADPRTEELCINHPGEFFLRQGGAFARHVAPALDFERLEGVAILAGALRGQRVGTEHPLLSTDLPAGHRLQVVLPPAVPPGTVSLTFRRPSDTVAPLATVAGRYDTSRWNRWERRREQRQADGTALLAPYDAGDIEGFFRGLVLAKRNILFCGATGGGKAQPDDALVLTPMGFRRMGDITLGDLVMAPDGKAVPVIGVYPQGEKEIYRVTFEDGRVVECCDDHLWKVWDWRSSYETGKTHATRSEVSAAGWSVLPLSAIRSWFAAGKPKAARAAVPLAEPFAMELPPQSLPIPPYALGVLLGDGCFRASTVWVGTADQHILERVGAELPDYELVPTAEVGGYDYRLRQRTFRQPSPLRVALDGLGLMGLASHEKFVPELYKRGSVAQRLAVLQGLLDTDGSVAGENGTCASCTSTSERLARDVQQLVWSLGGAASLTKRQTYVTGAVGDRRSGRVSYRVSITHPDVGRLFSLPRKIALCCPKSTRQRLRITSIEPVGRRPARCIAVDHPDRLYVTDGYVVTHNTFLSKTLTAEIPATERILTIEDALELVVPQPNCVRLLYSKGGLAEGGVTADALLQATLRMRPDRVLLQELRDEAAWVYLNEVMTGHPGSLTTIHGADAPQAMRRLFNLVKGTPQGAAYGDATLMDMLATAVDAIVPLRNDAGAYSIREVWFADDAVRRGETAADLLRAA